MRTDRPALWMGALAMMTLSAFGQEEVPPAGSAPKDFLLPKTRSFSLDNGLRATLVPYGNLPKVTLRVVVWAGNINEQPDEVWLSDLVGDFLKEGTATRTATQLAREAAAMGGDLTVTAGDDQTSITGNVLSEYGPAMVSLLSDVVRNPSFPESELERLKNDRARDLSIQKTDPNSITNERFRSLLYPDHPYGRIFPSEELLRGYTIQQVRNFYVSNFGAARTHIYVAGRFDEAGMEQAIRDAFRTWEQGPPRATNIPKPVSHHGLHLIDRPGAPQATVYLGLPTINPSDPDYRKFLVMNALLGGSFMSRITSNIREAKGYTYSPGSFLSARYRDAFWVQFASITTAVTGPALREIFFEIERLQSEPPSVEELQGIQNYVAGVFVLQNSSPAGIINLLSFTDLHGLPETYLTEYVKTVHSITPEEVRQLAQTHIRTDDMVIVVAGDRKQVEPQVREFGRMAGN